MKKFLVVFKDDQWFSLKLRSQPFLIQFFFLQLFSGNVMNVMLINIICGGSTTLNNTTIVICLLFSKFNICMFGTF